MTVQELTPRWRTMQHVDHETCRVRTPRVEGLLKARKQEAAEIIQDLAENPFPPDSKALRGFRDYYRVPFGGCRYRIVYRVLEQSRIVLVTRIRKRAHVYEGL